MITKMGKPTIVLVHGAWHGPEHWQMLITYLESHGYACVTVTLPLSNMGDVPAESLPTNIDLDIEAVRTIVLSALESNNVLVVAHSYGALPGVASLENLDNASRTAAGHTTSVQGIGIIAGMLLSEGHSVYSFWTKYDCIAVPAQQFEESGKRTTIAAPGPGYYFYNDVRPAELAIKLGETLRPQVFAVNLTDLPYAGHRKIPTRYLMATNDNIMPVENQKKFVEVARSGGVKVEVEVIDSGHSPFASRVSETGEFVRRCAGEVGLTSPGLGSF